MKEFIVKLWTGEPIIVFGFINTVLVALSLQYEWARIGALVTVPLLAWAGRQKVAPVG